MTDSTDLHRMLLVHLDDIGSLVLDADERVPYDGRPRSTCERAGPRSTEIRGLVADERGRTISETPERH